MDGDVDDDDDDDVEGNGLVAPIARRASLSE
jgi:hypothetical protein